MVHLRNCSKTYAPVPGFGGRQDRVVPLWEVDGIATSSWGSNSAAEEPPGRPGSVSRPPGAVNIYQPSYFCITSMRNKSAPPAEFSRQTSTNFHDVRPISSYTSSSNGRLKPKQERVSSCGQSVLPTVTGTSIAPGALSPRSEYNAAVEGQELTNADFENIDSVSLQGAGEHTILGGVDYHKTDHPTIPTADNQSVTTVDAQSEITDQTADDRSLVPFQVTFTKARGVTEGNIKRSSSPKSVRFSLPDKSETGSQVPGGAGGGIHWSSRSSDISYSGSSVVDGFFVQPSSNHATSWLNNSENHRPVTSVSITSSAPDISEMSSITTATSMKSRGALSNSKQVPGRYFPPLGLSDDPGRSSIGPFLSMASGRVGSSHSTVSAPSALGAAGITQLQKIRRIPNFAVTSSRSWAKGNDHAKSADDKSKKALKSKTYSLASPGMDARPINQDSQRDTIYNRKKQSFWEMYDANPHKFTISLRDECPSYDPQSVLHSDYYSTRRTPEPAKLSRSNSVKSASLSSFHGCLEGSAKTLHTKKVPGQYYET